jgi:hypothetical protein
MSRIPPLAPSTSRVLSALVRCAVVAVFLSDSLLIPKPVIPTFTDYHVAGTYEGAVKQPVFGRREQYSGADLRCFGEDPAAYSIMRVNFAGHFVVAACTCGSGCHYLFLWDAENGKVYRDFPFGAINVGPYGPATRGRQVEMQASNIVPTAVFWFWTGALRALATARNATTSGMGHSLRKSTWS